MGEKKTMNRKVRLAIIITLVVAAAVLLFIMVIVLHEKETSSDIASYSEKAPGAAGYIDATFKVISADLSRETVDIQAEFMAKGDLLDSSGLLKHDVSISILGAGMEEDRVLAAGDWVDFTSGTINLNGNVSDYPWDKHSGQIFLKVYAESEGGDAQTVPTRLQFYGSLPGLDTNFHPGSRDNETIRELKLTFVRSKVTTTVVCFSILLIWILIATVVSMVVVVLIGHDLHMMMFAFFGTLLFAMTSFRNAMPGTPPMGVLSDYLAFFWGYAVAIAALGIITVVWLHRLPPRSELEAKKEKRAG